MEKLGPFPEEGRNWRHMVPGEVCGGAGHPGVLGGESMSGWVPPEGDGAMWMLQGDGAGGVG